jgi:hypothetical protein
MISPRSTLIDFALDLVENDDVGSSSTSDISSLDFSNFKRNHSQLLSACKEQHKLKFVCFDEYDEVAEISHINDFSQKKIDRLWFSPEEQSEIRAECLELVERFNAGEVMDKEVMLGLEKQTKAGLEPVADIRQIVNEAVFSLQKVQQRTFVAEPSLLIAKFYEASCAKPCLEARLSALKLALEVKTESKSDFQIRYKK